MQGLTATIDHLCNTYRVDNRIFYLSDYFKNNGEQHLYNWLMSCRKDSFNNDERLLFVQDCPDIHDYDNMPGRGLTSLQKYLVAIDISNFFLMIVSSNTEILQEISQVKKLFSTDPVEMQYTIFFDNVISVPLKKFNDDSFCVLPWIHLYIGPDGNVLPCCVGDKNHPIGSVDRNSLPEIINSENFKKLRSNMLEHKKPIECRYCHDQENLGLLSFRKQQNQKWNHIEIIKNQDGTVKNFKPIYLDIRLSNICNLKCRMCDSYYSSAIAQENSEIHGSKSFDILHRNKRQDALDEILEYLDSVEELYFAGGEPLLSSEHYTILSKLRTLGKTNVKIRYSTNLTTLLYKKQSVIDFWKDFDDITVNASIDAEHQAAEYIRFGTVWTEIEKNINLIKIKAPQVKINIMSTVGFMNIDSLINLQKRWTQNNIIESNCFTFTTMISPEFLTVTVLPHHHKTKKELIINEHINWCVDNGAEKLAKLWQDLVKYMWSRDDSHYLNEFKKVTIRLDTHRNQSFADVFPEYKDLI